MNKKKLFHGQALAMQWVGFALQKLIVDVKAGGSITNQLIVNAKSVSGNDALNTLALGCSYVVNFVLPFSLELALKSLLIKGGNEPKFIHDLLDLYNGFSADMKLKLQNEYSNQLEIVGLDKTESLEELLSAHRNDFKDWRYLENTEKLMREEKEMQAAISAILEIDNSHN
jgi:hypothetical protein